MDAVEIAKGLEELETKIEQLRALYEQYFMGLERIEPLIHRRDVERRVKVLRREQLRNTAQRFKFNTLVQRFNTMQQHWARVVREIENGTYRRDVLRAAARFGEGALTALGKKKMRDLAAAAVSPQKRAIEEPFELEADDLIEEIEEVDEVAPPPTATLERPAALPPPPAPAPRPVAAFVGLRLSEPKAPGPPPQAPGASPVRSAGLRWNAPPAEPESPGRPTPSDVKRRVAELAAQASTTRASRPSDGFGELSLDLDDSPAAGPAPPAPSPGPPGRSPSVGVAPSKPAVSPKARAELGSFAPGGMEGQRPQTVKVAAPPADKAASALGVLDAPFAGSPPPTPNRASPAVPAVAIPAPRPPARPAPPSPGAASGPTPRAPTEPAGEIPDQRIRQIYAKYVEAKRSTQESTAGVTFDKLAASLRAQETKLRSAHPNKSVDYEVVVKDGKTHIKPILR